MVNAPPPLPSRSNDVPEPSSSAAAAPPPPPATDPPATLENPVVATVQKAKDTIKRHVAQSRSEQRPSVRLVMKPSTQPRSDGLSHGPNSGDGDAGCFSMLRRKLDSSSNNEKQEQGQPAREPVMVSRRVADGLAPHIAAAQAEGHDDPHALAQEMAANPDAYIKKPADQGKVRKLITWVKGSDDDAYGSTVHAKNSDAYDSEMVDLLDVVDPQVSTLSTLTNVQNSLFVPQLGRIVNRQPAYNFSTEPEELRRLERLKGELRELKSELKDRAKRKIRDILKRPQPIRAPSISSQMTDWHWAVLNHGETLQGWSEEDKEWLDDLVRHSLHSRRAKMKRAFKGFGQYVRRPLGLFVTVYATLITIFGAAWVLFLIGWISIGSKRDYIVNVVDNVLVALFAVMGDGLAPFRAVDTYHMVYIAWYYRKTWKLRRKLGLPDLVDHNDLPEQTKEDLDHNTDVESLAGRPSLDRRSTGSFVGEYSVLSESQQEKLQHHQRKFSKSHTFYKPHETATHYAFPLKLLVAIVILLDFHSMLQITLGACTWGIPYQHRPFALTTVILCCSITCNITGGVLIAIGDRRTRKHDVLELMMRRELTSEAIEKIQKTRLKEAEELGVIDRETRKKAEEEMEQAENEEIKSEWKQVHLLPKKLLGKSVDTREPALPKKHRRNQRHRRDLDEKEKNPVPPDPTTAHVQAPKPQAQNRLAQRLGLASPPQQNTDVVDHAVGVPPAPKPSGPTQSRMNKATKMFRRADMDMS